MDENHATDHAQVKRLAQDELTAITIHEYHNYESTNAVS